LAAFGGIAWPAGAPHFLQPSFHYGTLRSERSIFPTRDEFPDAGVVGDAPRPEVRAALFAPFITW